MKSLQASARPQREQSSTMTIALGEWLLGLPAARLGLVALLREVSAVQGATVAAHSFLQDLAAKAGVDFLSHVAEERTLPTKSPAESIPSGGIGLFSSEGLRSIEVARRCWGINE